MVEAARSGRGLREFLPMVEAARSDRGLREFLPMVEAARSDRGLHEFLPMVEAARLGREPQLMAAVQQDGRTESPGGSGWKPSSESARRLRLRRKAVCSRIVSSLKAPR